MTNEELYAPIREKYQMLKKSLETDDLQHIIKNAAEVHAMVHPSLSLDEDNKTISDYVLSYMLKGNNKVKSVPRMNCGVSLDWAGTDYVPMCWQFWHTYRIEDLVSNILIANTKQIFNDEWKKRINSPISDTGNALENDEVISFGKMIDAEALRDYMIEVSKNTGRIITKLTSDMLKKKPSEEQLERILIEGGLTSDKRSVWLLDYWGGLTVEGMILTPLTDHHMMHLPPCLDNLPIL